MSSKSKETDASGLQTVHSDVFTSFEKCTEMFTWTQHQSKSMYCEVYYLTVCYHADSDLIASRSVWYVSVL